MEENANIRKNFIEEAESVVIENAANEQFGVSELAEAMKMSRSNLLRKIKKDTSLSASQFIRQIRLKKGMELIQSGTFTVSEVSYQVGFGSVSYFIKCFREQYGYPPGEVGKVEQELQQNEAPVPEEPATAKIMRAPWVGVLAAFILIAVIVLLIIKRDAPMPKAELEKSIAVLPFKNESSDSSNLYFVNGLMESTLSSLQKIKDLRVISRTSSEKYRHSAKSIPEIAEELNVSYIVEGSGQRIGDQVLLNIQLIEASGDRHIWAEQYNRELIDIFELQNEVAIEITHAIEAIVTPAEQALLEKKPTESVEAYDYFLQALEPFHRRSKEGLEKAIPLFEKAISYDEQFALAYANIAISYYLLDLFQQEKQYTEKINTYSDQALLYDSKSDVSLISKAFFYLHTKDYRLALPHLEKALEYNPNSHVALQMLSDFYAHRDPNTSKYLEYALRGTQLDVIGKDSVANSYAYLQLSNALVQSGFLEEALDYVNRSLAYQATNYFAPHLKIFVRFAMDGDAKRTQELLRNEWRKDTTRLDILQDLAKICYVQKQYDSAHYYYEKFTTVRAAQQLNMYLHENAKIAYVYREMGLEEEAAAFFEDFILHCEQDQSIYQSANLAFKQIYLNEMDQAIEQLKIFATKGNFQYWFLLIESDPMMEPLKTHPEYNKVLQQIKDRFWDDHQKLRSKLEAQGLI